MSEPDLAAMKLLLDQGIPAGAAPMFRQLGYNCRHVSELSMQKAEDAEILSIAPDQGRVVITLDADFHALIAVGGLKTPSVIRLRRAKAAERIPRSQSSGRCWSAIGQTSKAVL